MKAELINPFVTATVNVFATMLNCPLSRGALQLRSAGFAPEFDITGIIGLSGAMPGTVLICLEEHVALKATEAMLGTLPTEINTDVIDAVGEIANMVAGNAKSQMAAFNLYLSIPTVIVGRNQKIGFTSNIGPICIPYQSAWGPLHVEVGFRQ